MSGAKHKFKRDSLIAVFSLQLSTVWKAHAERHKASRARGLGSWEQGPVLRMDRQQAPPWVHLALILFLLSLGGAIEIPMDREFRSGSVHFVPDGGGMDVGERGQGGERSRE